MAKFSSLPAPAILVESAEKIKECKFAIAVDAIDSKMRPVIHYHSIQSEREQADDIAAKNAVKQAEKLAEEKKQWHAMHRERYLMSSKVRVDALDDSDDVFDHFDDMDPLHVQMFLTMVEHGKILQPDDFNACFDVCGS